MPNLSIRKIDGDVYTLLRVQAAEHGVSMEEEVRRILKRAVTMPGKLGDYAAELFSPCYGEELEIPQREIHKPVSF